MRISDRSSDVCSSDLLAQEEGRRVISHETIYRFVYDQLRRTNDRRWRFYLPRAKYKRGWRTKGGWPRYTDRPSIHDRPADIATRKQAGHWEADAMLFSTPGQAILIAHERHSRSEEHTSELQSLMRISSAVFCLKKKNKKT